MAELLGPLLVAFVLCVLFWPSIRAHWRRIFDEPED